MYRAQHQQAAQAVSRQPAQRCCIGSPRNPCLPQALHIAAERCAGGKAAAGAIRALLNAGAAATAVDGGGRQALHLAIGAPATALEAVQVLLTHRADPNAACLAGGGWRPLHAVALLPDGGAAAQLIAALVEAGGRLDAADAAGSTALAWTARNVHQRAGSDASGRAAAASIAAALIAAGASPHARDAAGMQPLHCAAAAAADNSSAAKLINVLVAAGAGLESRDAAGRTPLELAAAAAAAKGGDAGAAAVQVLVEAGASAGPLLRRL